MITLIPAYGRVYDNQEDMLADWNNGKDFKILNGPYCSVRDEKLILDRHDMICFYDLTTKLRFHRVV